MRNRFRKLFKFLPWFILSIVAIYFTLLGGWRDATYGRFHRKSFELFSDVNGITKVEVYLLMGEESELQEVRFPIRPYERTDPTYGSVELSGKDLQDFIDVWRYQEASFNKQALCHYPAYGFRLYKGGKLVGETSICWQCSNYYVTVYPGMSSWYGFDAHGEMGQALLDFCDERLPYKRIEKDLETTETEDSEIE